MAARSPVVCRRLRVRSRSARRRQALTVRKCDCITLPSDVIINDILPRVPSEILHSWRFACKQWFQVMYNDPMFIDAQLAKSKRKFIFDIDVEDYSHKQMEVDIVFNETTRTITSFTCSSIFPGKFDWIKDEKGSNIAIDISVEFSSNSCNGLGYDPFSKKYKVVHFFRDFNNQMDKMHDGCEVLTLGTNTWRPIELPFVYRYDLDRPISVGTYLHFRYKDWDEPGMHELEGHGEKPYFYKTIASMDIVNETCRLTSPPDAISGPFNLLTIGESLALAPCDSVCDHIDIWILDNCVKGLWSKKFSIAKDLHYGCGRSLRSRLPDFLRPIATLNNGKVVIFQEFNELRLFYFVVGCNKFREIQSPWKKLHSGDPRYPAVIKVFDHISTLVSPYAQ